mgnify:CR=1 FL=1
MSSYNIQCGRRFREERLRLGLTQAQLHRATGISQHTIVAYECGDSILYIRQKELFESLGFNLQYIYFGFEIEAFFDAVHQIIMHMLENDRGVDRKAAIDILKSLASVPEQDITPTGGAIRAALSLAAKK